MQWIVESVGNMDGNQQIVPVSELECRQRGPRQGPLESAAV